MCVEVIVCYISVVFLRHSVVDVVAMTTGRPAGVKVVINKRRMKLLEEALTGVNVRNCHHPCAGQPCLHSGRCHADRDLYRCSCPLGYLNTNCEDSTPASSQRSL